jgi:hypothetical protein
VDSDPWNAWGRLRIGRGSAGLPTAVLTMVLPHWHHSCGRWGSRQRRGTDQGYRQLPMVPLLSPHTGPQRCNLPASVLEPGWRGIVAQQLSTHLVKAIFSFQNPTTIAQDLAERSGRIVVTGDVDVVGLSWGEERGDTHSTACRLLWLSFRKRQVACLTQTWHISINVSCFKACIVFENVHMVRVLYILRMQHLTGLRLSTRIATVSAKHSERALPTMRALLTTRSSRVTIDCNESDWLASGGAQIKRTEILDSFSDTSMFARSTLARRPAHIDHVKFRLPT